MCAFFSWLLETLEHFFSRFLHLHRESEGVGGEVVGSIHLQRQLPGNFSMWPFIFIKKEGEITFNFIHFLRCSRTVELLVCRRDESKDNEVVHVCC